MKPGCPKCGLTLEKDLADHCAALMSRSCWWGVHKCGAVIDVRYPSRWLDFPFSTEE